MTQPTSSQSPDLDRLAMVLSFLCIVHCLALPVLLVAMPLLAQFADSHWHTPMLAIALPVSAIAIVIGYRRHGNLRLVAAVTVGLALLVGGATFGHTYLGVVADRSMTVAGSLILAYAHWQNSRLVRRCALRADTLAVQG